MAEQTDGINQGRGPFDSGSDGAFYFEEAIREKRLNLLLHLAPYSEVLLVTGEQGGGKTCLVERFIARAGEGWRICRLAATPDTAPERVIGALEEAFALNVSAAGEDREKLVRRMREGLHALRHSALVPLLVVDDAHHLPVSALRLLAELTSPLDGDEKLLALVLVGDTGVNDTLAEPGLEDFRARISHSFDLPAMSEEETGRYIRHRLSAAGVESGGMFPPSVIKFIHVASRGLPGRINELSREVLRNSRQRPVAPAAGARRRGGSWRYGVAALAVAGLALGMLYKDRWLGDTPAGSQQAGRELRPGPVFESPAAQPPEAAREEPPRPPGPGGRSSDDAAPATRDIPGTAAAGRAAETDAGPTARSGAQAEAPPAIAADTGAGGTGTEVESGTGTETGVGTEAGSRTRTGGGAVSDEATPARPSVDGPAAPDTPRARGAPEDLKGGAWLRAQDAGRYTVQLLAMAEPKALDYIERHGLRDQVAVYRTRSGGRELLAVTYGLFDDRTAAARAGTRVAERLGGGLSPWVRPVGDIQAALGGNGDAASGAATAGGGPGVRGEQWLMARDAGRYTLQLLAGEEDKVLAFVGRHDIAQDAALYRTSGGNGELTAVTYGVYADRAAAERAAGSLGGRLGVSPWPRRFGEVQAAISARRAARDAGVSEGGSGNP